MIWLRVFLSLTRADAGSRPHRHLFLCSYPIDSNNNPFFISEHARVIYFSLIVQSIEIFSLSRQEQFDLLSTLTLFHDTKWSLNASKSIISDSDSSALTLLTADNGPLSVRVLGDGISHLKPLLITRPPQQSWRRITKLPDTEKWAFSQWYGGL